MLCVLATVCFLPRTVFRGRAWCHGLGRVCRFAVLVLWVMKDMLCVNVPTHMYNPVETKIAGMILTMLQVFGQNALVKVSKYICGCMDVMPGAGSDDQYQTSDEP